MLRENLKATVQREWHAERGEPGRSARGYKAVMNHRRTSIPRLSPEAPGIGNDLGKARFAGG